MMSARPAYKCGISVCCDDCGHAGPANLIVDSNGLLNTNRPLSDCCLVNSFGIVDFEGDVLHGVPMLLLVGMHCFGELSVRLRRVGVDGSKSPNRRTKNEDGTGIGDGVRGDIFGGCLKALVG